LRIGPRRPIAAVLCSCNGRGANLFGSPHHDSGLVARKFRDIPLAGLFCAGEIGPVGSRTFLHGFTASLGIIVPADSAYPE
jgi:small ligand-binding sensory domain FIST